MSRGPGVSESSENVTEVTDVAAFAVRTSASVWVLLGASRCNRCVAVSVPFLPNCSARVDGDDTKKNELAQLPARARFNIRLRCGPLPSVYNEEIDPTAASQFGLAAENVEKVNPDLVVRARERRPYYVRYDQVNAMLLNDFSKSIGRWSNGEQQSQN